MFSKLSEKFDDYLFVKMLYCCMAELNISVSCLYLVGTAAAMQSDDECKCGDGLLHPNLIIGLIICLLILSVLVSIEIPRETKENDKQSCLL